MVRTLATHKYDPGSIFELIISSMLRELFPGNSSFPPLKENKFQNFLFDPESEGGKFVISKTVHCRPFL